MATTAGTVTTASINNSTPTAQQLPVYQPEEYTVAGVVLKFFEDKAKDVAKALGYSAFWVGQAVPNLPPEVKSFSTMMGDFKNFVGATEIPKKAKEAWDAYKDLWADLTNESGPSDKAGKFTREAFKKSTSLTNSIADGIDFSSRFIPIDHKVMAPIKAVNFAATVGGSGVGACEQIENLANTKEHETSKQTLYVINLVRDISYVILGSIGLAAVVGVATIAPWMYVACLTSGLTCTIGGYFHEKLNDPEGKGKNLNPEIVIKNNLARRQHEQNAARA